MKCYFSLSLPPNFTLCFTYFLLLFPTYTRNCFFCWDHQIMLAHLLVTVEWKFHSPWSNQPKLSRGSDEKKRKTHNSFLYDVYFPFVTTRLVWSRWKLEQKLYDMLAGRLFGWKIFTFQHLRERESLMSDLSVDEKRELMLIGPFLGAASERARGDNELSLSSLRPVAWVHGQ